MTNFQGQKVNALKRFCIIMQVQDKRDVVYQDRRTALLFPGEGQSLVDDENGDKNLKVESQPQGSFECSVTLFHTQTPFTVRTFER